MKKIIAVSVYGTNPRYFEGAIKNANIAKILFPDWIYKVYLGSKRPDGFKEKISSISNVEVVDMEEFFVATPSMFGPGVFWRFLEMFNSEDQIMICRDSDTRLIEREKRCVDEWLNSNKKFSVIRDHPAHFEFPIIATMWGIKGKIDVKYRDEMKKYEKDFRYLSDQYYLRDIIWPLAKNDVLIHQLGDQTWFSNQRKKDDKIFIGQGYDENDNPIYPSWS